MRIFGNFIVILNDRDYRLQLKRSQGIDSSSMEKFTSGGIAAGYK